MEKAWNTFFILYWKDFTSIFQDYDCRPYQRHYIAKQSHYLSCLWLRPMPQLLIAWLRNLGGQDISSNEILRKITAWNICQHQASWKDNLVSSFKHATEPWNQLTWSEILLLGIDLVIYFNDKHTVSILYWGHNNVNRLPNNTVHKIVHPSSDW